MRSGRVKIVAGGAAKTIIYAASGGSPAIRYYRVYNSGKNTTQPITITGADHGAVITLPAHESVDFGVKTNDILVTPHASEDAEVVYDFLG